VCRRVYKVFPASFFQQHLPNLFFTLMLLPDLLHQHVKSHVLRSLLLCNSGGLIICVCSLLRLICMFKSHWKQYFTGVPLPETGECKCFEYGSRKKHCFFKWLHSSLNIKQPFNVSSFAFLLSKPDLIYAKHNGTPVCAGWKQEYIILDGEMSHPKYRKQAAKLWSVF